MFRAAFSGRSEKSSSTSQRKKASGTESGVSTSSRKAEDEKHRSERSRGNAYEDESADYEDAPTSRRALTESAVNLLNEDGEDEDWEDDDKDARSERRSMKSDGRRHRHRSEKERSRSRSREHKSDRKSKSSRKGSEISRGKTRALDEGDDRAIPDMGSFEQFPGQYSGGHMGDGGNQEFMMSGALSNSADAQFGPTRSDTFGAAADYYQDEGQSVSAQPGYRAKSPNMLVNPDHHLMAATADEQPAQDTGHGSAADFYGGKTSPVPFTDASGKPARQSSGPSKPGKGRTGSVSLGATAATSAAIGAAGMATGAGSSQYQSQSQSQSQYSSSSRPPRRPSRQNSEPIPSGSSSTYYAPPPQNMNGSGKQPSTNSNAGLYAAGAAAAVGAAGLAAYEMHEHHEHQQQQQPNGYAATNSQYGTAAYGAQSSYTQQGGQRVNGGTAYSQPFHEHKGPMTRLKDGFLNLLASEEDVVKMEMYTEYIGVCKYCFDPRTSPTDAPRVHHYHSSARSDSFEDLRRRKSIEIMKRSSREGLNRTGSSRVDKDSRYYATDTAKRRKSTDKATLVGAGLAAAGAAAGASMLMKDDRKDFDDTYSVKSGHRESSAVRRRSRSSSREMRRKSSHGFIDNDTKEEYVTVKTKDGRIERRKVKQRSRSTSKERTGSLAATAAGAAIGATTVAAASSRHGRQRSPKRSRRSRSSSREKESQGFFGSIFSPSRKEKKRRDSRSERRKKQSGFFNFGNGSVSSSDNDLAFGASRTDLSLRRKSSMKSVKKKSSDEHIAATVAGITTTAAALAAAQNGRRVKPANGVELGARRDTKTTPVAGPAYQGSEEEWEDEQELPSDVDDATSAEGDLAFGDYDRRRLSKRQSMESVNSQSSGGGFLGWRWGRKDKRSKRRPSKPVSLYSPRTDGSYVGSVAAGAAAGAVGSKLARNESAMTSTSSIPPRPMQEIDPRPMSETGSYAGSRHASIPGAFDSYAPTSRPGPAPIQQPKPITPIKPVFTQSPPEMDERDVPRPTPRRTQSSPTQNGNFMQDAALIGAAAIGTAGIIAAAGRKSKEPSNVRFGFTEEQEKKHERELQREREKAEDERQRNDREKKLKDEAARYTREQDVLRAREAENRKKAEAELERQRAAQREAEEQAEEYRRREREHQEREEAYNRERARKAEEDRRQEEERQQRESDEADRRKRERDEDERRQREQYEADRRQRERDDDERRQREQYELERRQREQDDTTRNRREQDVQRYPGDRDRYSRERDQERYRQSSDRQSYERRDADDSKDSSVPWGAVAAGAAVAGAGAYAANEYSQRKERERDEQREYAPREDRGERRESYSVREVKPPEERRSKDDDDVYNPEYYRRGTRGQSDYARHVELARRAASKVVNSDQVFAENEAAYSERSQSQAEFFAPEELTRKAEGKEKSSDRTADSRAGPAKSADEEHRDVFNREWAVAPQPRSRYAPYGVPKLDLVSPTPPPSATSLRRRRSTEPSPLAASDSDEFQRASDVSKSSPRRSISWGVDKTHVYDAPTPEADHDGESYVGHRDVSTAVAATSAAVAVAAAGALSQRANESATDSKDSRNVVEDGARSVKASDKSQGASLYKQPSYESVSDIHLPKSTPQTTDAEGDSTSRASAVSMVDERAPEQERTPHIPGGFDDDDYEAEQPAALIATESEPRDDPSASRSAVGDNEKNRSTGADTSMTATTTDSPEEQVIDEEPQPKPPLERKLSKKEKRKLEKAAKRGETVDDEQPTRSTDDKPAPEESSEYTRAGESDLQRSDGNKKQSFVDIAGAVMTTGGVAAVAAGSSAKDDERSSGKKSSKKSDKKKAKKSRETEWDTRQPDPPDDQPATEREEESTAMPGSWDESTRDREDESPTEVVDPFQYQVHDDHEEYHPYPLTTKAPPVTSVQETTARPRGSSLSGERDVEMNGHNAAEDLVRSQNRSSQSMADVASAIYDQRANRSSKDETESSRRGDSLSEQSENRPNRSMADVASAVYEKRADRSSKDETQSRQHGDYEQSPTEDRRQAPESNREQDSQRTSNGGASRNDDRDYEEPDTYDDARSTATSDRRDDYSSSRKSKRRSRGTEDDTVSVASSGSRRSKDSPDSSKKDKKGGFFGGMFGRKSAQSGESSRHDGDSLSRQSTKDSREDEGEDAERRRRRRRHTESEYGEDDDSRSVASESRRKHHHRRRTEDDDYSLSRRDDGDDDRHHHHHHRRSTNDDSYDREQSFLEMGVEGMPPLPDNSSESKDSAPVKEEQDYGMPASAEQDSESTTRDHASAFELIRQDEHERPAADAFDLIRQDQHERAAAEPFDLIRHATPEHETMDVDKIEPNETQDQGDSNSRDVEMQDGTAAIGSDPASPTAMLETGLPGRRLSLNRPVSTTAVPLRFPHGTQPPTSSPRVDRAASFGGSLPQSPATPMSASRSRQNRPTSTEIRPLYLVERNRKIEDVEDTLPSLPSSKQTSRASSQVGSDEYESAEEGSDAPLKRRPLTIDVDRAASFQQEPDYLDSQQTTPRASEPPRPIFDKPPRQEPQFYTWEDFVREERRRNEDRDLEQPGRSEHEEYTEARRPSTASRSAEDYYDSKDLPALPPSRPESRTASRDEDGIGTGVAAAAVLGGAAMLAHYALKEDDSRQEKDVSLEDDSTTRVASRDIDHFEDSERLMEEGEAPGSPMRIEIAPSPEPNELDLFLDAEERMEEGQIEAEFENERGPAADISATQGQDRSMEQGTRETIDEFMESEEQAEAARDESNVDLTEPVLEPPSLMTSVREVVASTEQNERFSSPVEPKDDASIAGDVEPIAEASTAQEEDFTPKLTRKQSKKAKKKQKAAAWHATEEDTSGQGDMQDAPIEDVMITGHQPSGESAAFAANDTDTFAENLDTNTQPTADRDVVLTDEHAPSGQDRVEADDQRSSEHPVLQAEDPNQSTVDVDPAQPDEPPEDVPFLSRKKSKKDKKKQRQQTKEDKQSSRRTIASVQEETLADEPTSDMMDIVDDVSVERREEQSQLHQNLPTEEQAATADTSLPDIDDESRTLDSEAVATSESRDLAASTEPSPLEADTSETDYKTLRPTSFSHSDPHVSEAPTGATDLETDDITPDVKHAQNTLDENEAALTPPNEPDDSTRLDHFNAASETPLATEDRRLPQNADDQVDREAVREDEPADEFTWTSSSKKKKGKQAKKSKKSTKDASTPQKLPTTAREAELIEPAADVAAPELPSYESVQEHEEQAVDDIPPLQSSDRHVIHTEEGLGRAEAREQLTSDSYMQDEDPNQSESQDVETKDKMLVDKATLEEPSEEPEQEIPEEVEPQQTTDNNRQFLHRAADVGEPIPDEQANPDESTAAGVEGEAEEPEFVWTSSSKKKGKKGKKSKRAVEEETPTQETVDVPEPEAMLDDQRLAEDSTAAEEAPQTSGIEDVQFWTAPPKGKKSKKDKKSKRSAIINTEEDTTMSEQPAVSGGADDETRDAPLEEALAPTEPANFDDDNSWLPPVKAKKAKKLKKAKLAAMEEGLDPPNDDAEMAEPPQQQSFAEEGFAGQGTENDVPASDMYDRGGENAPIVRGSMQDDIAALTPLPEGDEQENEDVAESGIDPPEDSTPVDHAAGERSHEERDVDLDMERLQSVTSQQDVIGELENIEGSKDTPASPNADIAMPDEQVQWNEDEAKVLDNEHPTTTEPEQMAPEEEPDQLEPEEPASRDASIPFVAKKGKKEKKKGKKSRTSTTDYWAEEEAEASTKPVAEESTDQTAAKEAETTAVGDGSLDEVKNNNEAQEDEQDWTSFSTKSSKKDKKGKKPRASTTEYWADEEAEASSKPAAEERPDQTGAREAETTAAVDRPWDEVNNDAEAQEKEEDWTSFSTKRSKKDKKEKKKDKKRSSIPTTAVLDIISDEPQPFLEPSHDDNMDPSESMEIDRSLGETGAMIHPPATSDTLDSESVRQDQIPEDPSSLDRDPPVLAEVLDEEEKAHSITQQEDQEMAYDAEAQREQHTVVEPHAEGPELTAPELRSELPSGQAADFYESSSHAGNDTRGTEGQIEEAEPIKNARVAAAPSDAEHDIDFAATVAAGLADSGFDADLVVNDPAFQRRASPPGIAEADPEETFPTSTKKGRKSKKNKRGSVMEDAIASEQPREATSSSTPRSQEDDLNETLERTLAGSGFDTALLQRIASKDDAPANEITGDSMFSFATSKRKKGKKSKTRDSTALVEPEPEPETQPDTVANLRSEDTNTAFAEPDPSRGDIDPDFAPYESQEPGPDLQREETNTTNELSEDMNALSNEPSAATGNPDIRADAILAGDREMDVDEMDSAYRTFKKKKRDKKKQKAAAPKATNVSQAESVSEAEQPEQGFEPGETPLEEDRSRTPTMPSDAVAIDTDRNRDAHEAERSDYRGDNEYSHQSGPSSWSFANLDDEVQGNADSPAFDDKERALVRDSGYQTADSPLIQRKSVDSATFNVPEIRTPQSRESLHERRSGEPLRIPPDNSPDWHIRPSKTRDAPSDGPLETLHSRTPSQATTETPLESTTKNRASYLFSSPPENVREVTTFDDSPTPGARPASLDEVRSAFHELSPQATRESGFLHEDDSVLSQASGASGSQRLPLDTIPEERQGQKRTISETGLAEPDSAKSTRRSEPPQSLRSRDRAFSPATRPSVSIPSSHGRSVSDSRSTDHSTSRAPWSSADDAYEPGSNERSHRRRTSRQASADIRSPSAMSNRSNTSASQIRSPEELRSYSRASNRSATPSLRRVSLSGDLRAASLRGETGSAVGARASPKTIPFEAPPTPPPNDDEVMDTGASRSIDMSDVYQGYGDAEASQVSPTRPPNMRKRQSMHIMELESKVDQLVAENEALQDARRNRGLSAEDVDSEDDFNLRLREKDNEINQVRTMLQSMQDEISRLNEINAGLSEANRNMVDDNNGQFATLQAEHAHAHEQWENTSRELDDVRQEHGRLTSGMREVVEAEIATALAEKNSEIRQLREDLEVATERIRALQVQIQNTRSRDFLTVRDEDYFDGACQKLCQHVQQWVLRFSKMSDDRRCRLSTDLNDDKIEQRLDNVVLDGSDVDRLLADRIKRRDVFMSVVMTMIWEYVFTRYLFGMDREQRKKLKDLEKMLEEVGPKRAVSQWRATTLTLLSQRPAFAAQRDLDTEAVATEVYTLLTRFLPPPSNGEQQLLASLRKVINIAVDLSIDMRCQRAEYIMLPPLTPEYDTNGDLVQKVYFNASLMNERSGTFSSNGELEQSQAIVKIVLFPLVVKKGDDLGEGEEEIVVCPAQVLVHSDGNRSGKRIVRVQSGAMEIDDPRRSQKSLVSPGGSMAF